MGERGANAIYSGLLGNQVSLVGNKAFRACFMPLVMQFQTVKLTVWCDHASSAYTRWCQTVSVIFSNYVYSHPDNIWCHWPRFMNIHQLMWDSQCHCSKLCVLTPRQYGPLISMITLHKHASGNVRQSMSRSQSVLWSLFLSTLTIQPAICSAGRVTGYGGLTKKKSVCVFFLHRLQRDLATALDARQLSRNNYEELSRAHQQVLCVPVCVHA